MMKLTRDLKLGQKNRDVRTLYSFFWCLGLGIDSEKEVSEGRFGTKARESSEVR